MAFHTEHACSRLSRMWKKMGEALELRALEMTNLNQPHTAISFARAAEACFWQATGETETISFGDVK